MYIHGAEPKYFARRRATQLKIPKFFLIHWSSVPLTAFGAKSLPLQTLRWVMLSMSAKLLLQSKRNRERININIYIYIYTHKYYR